MSTETNGGRRRSSSFKNLLLPAFADSGANDTFKKSKQSNSNSNSNNTINDYPDAADRGKNTAVDLEDNTNNNSDQKSLILKENLDVNNSQQSSNKSTEDLTNLCRSLSKAASIDTATSNKNNGANNPKSKAVIQSQGCAVEVATGPLNSPKAEKSSPGFPALSPRWTSSFLQKQTQFPQKQTINLLESPNDVPLGNGRKGGKYSQLMRAKCWSLDATESSYVQSHDSPPMSPMPHRDYYHHPPQFAKGRQQPHQQQKVAPRMQETPKLSPKVSPDVISKSKSWDYGGKSGLEWSPRALINSLKADTNQSRETTTTPQHHQQPFRRGTPSFLPRSSGKLDLSDFSPSSRAYNTTQLELMSPQRIEIEREDALDLLSCLVERSQAFRHESDKSEADEVDETVTNNIKAVSNYFNRENRKSLQPKESNNNEVQNDFDVSASNINDSIKALRRISKEYDETKQCTEDENDISVDHCIRMKVLDELLRCQKYAHEMEQAASSASTWLKAIGRVNTNKFHERNLSVSEDPLLCSLSEIELSNEKIPVLQDLVSSLKQQLEELGKKNAEKDAEVRKLNAELSKCKAEIGRMKSASRAEGLLASPNRSIFDDESSCSTNEDLTFTENVSSTETPIDSQNAGSVRSKEAVSIHELSLSLKEVAEAKREILLLKAALVNAQDGQPGHNKDDVTANPESTSNDAAQSIDDILLNKNLSTELDDYEASLRKADLAEIRNLQDQLLVATSKDMVHVNKLGGEDFVTDWNFVDDLPPPPDHEINSPIVHELLRQWTTDPNLHESLVKWSFGILNGDLAVDVPPLKISNIDQRVKDGFITHIFALLLRRPDIHLDVKTRLRKITTYDISVSVYPRDDASANNYKHSLNKINATGLVAFKASSGGNSTTDNGSRRDTYSVFSDARSRVSDYWKGGGVGSVTSSVVTPLVSNRMNGNYTSFQHGGSLSDDDTGLYGDDRSLGTIDSTTGRDGLMNTIGGALGGLLRKKNNNNAGVRGSVTFDDTEHSNYQKNNNFSQVPFNRVKSAPNSLYGNGGGNNRFTQTLPAIDAGEEDDTQDQEDFHRVVTAPPGKIGITFVQYRGHCMVSEVSDQSPLAGWVFRSDILIAIDDAPVSGLPVKDIVRALQSKNDSYRSLRVISSQDMHESTINLQNR